MPQSKSKLKYGIYDEKERRDQSLDTDERLPECARMIAEVLFEWLPKGRTAVPYDITLDDLAALLQRTYGHAEDGWHHQLDDHGNVIEPRLTALIHFGDEHGNPKMRCGEKGPFCDTYRVVLDRTRLELINKSLIEQGLMPPDMMLKCMARNTTIDPVTKKKRRVYDGWIKVQYMKRPDASASASASLALPAPKPKRSGPPRASPPRASPPPSSANPFDLLDEPAPASPTSSPAPSTPTPTSTVPPTIAAAAAYWGELASKRSPE